MQDRVIRILTVVAIAQLMHLHPQLHLDVVPFAHPGRRQEILPAQAFELSPREMPAVLFEE